MNGFPQWQPIETAPQGMIALFFNAKAQEVRDCMFVDWVVDGKFCGNRCREATHWTHLPSPPQPDLPVTEEEEMAWRELEAKCST